MALTSQRSSETAPPEDSSTAPKRTELATPAEAPASTTAADRPSPIAGQLEARRVMVGVLAGLVAAPSVVWWIVQAAGFLKNPGGFDFCIYFAAALALRDNPHAHIFDLHVIQAAARAHHAAIPLMPYSYPPLLAVALVPLARLPYIEAARIWVYINLAVWLLVTFLLAGSLAYACTGAQTTVRQHIAAIHRSGVGGWLRELFAAWRRHADVALFAAGVAVFASLSHEPAAKGVALGQVSILICFLLVVAPWLLRRGQPELAGVALALATVIKVFPVVLLAYYVLRGRWRVALGAAICLALAYVVMVRAVGLETVLATRSIFTLGTQSSMAANNHALAHVPMWIAAELGRTPGPATMRAGYALIATVAVAFVLGMLVMGWYTLRHRRSLALDSAAGSPHDLLGYAWAICTTILVSPIVWEHYGSWLLPAFALCLGYAARLVAQARVGRDRRGSARVALFAIVAVVIAYACTSRLFPFGYDMEASLSPGPYVMNVGIRPLFMVLRPLGTTLAWIATGWLFLRPAFALRRMRSARSCPQRLTPPAHASQIG